MLKLTLAFILVLAGTASSSADFASATCDAPKNVEPILTDSACAGFVAHDARGREVNRVGSGHAISGAILASPDGRSVVMLHSYPKSEGFGDATPAIVFFRDGKQIATYSMLDVIVKMDTVGSSISHRRWLEERPPLVLGKTLVIKTLSKRVLEYDVATGKLVPAKPQR